MAVYGLKNSGSDEMCQRISITETYYDIMNYDYTLLSEEYLTEAIDLKKIKDTVVEKLRGIFKAIRTAVDALIGRIGELKDKVVKKVNEMLDKNAVKRLEKVKAIKFSENLGLREPNITGITPAKLTENESHKMESDIERMMSDLSKGINSTIDKLKNTNGKWEEDKTSI